MKLKIFKAGLGVRCSAEWTEYEGVLRAEDPAFYRGGLLEN